MSFRQEFSELLYNQIRNEVPDCNIRMVGSICEIPIKVTTWRVVTPYWADDDPDSNHWRCDVSFADRLHISLRDEEIVVFRQSGIKNNLELRVSICEPNSINMVIEFVREYHDITTYYYGTAV